MPTINFSNGKSKITLHKADVNLLLKAAGVMELLARNENDAEAASEFQAACDALRSAVIFYKDLGNEPVREKDEPVEPAPETTA